MIKYTVNNIPITRHRIVITIDIRCDILHPLRLLLEIVKRYVDIYINSKSLESHAPLQTKVMCVFSQAPACVNLDHKKCVFSVASYYFYSLYWYYWHAFHPDNIILCPCTHANIILNMQTRKYSYVCSSSYYCLHSMIFNNLFITQIY